MSDSAEYMELLWSSGALLLRDESFTLKSGRRSFVYANHRDLICVPDHLRLFSRELAALARRTFESPFALATVDSSVSPFLVAACALQDDIPYYNYRPVSREKGVAGQLFRYDSVKPGAHADDLPAVLLDDVVTTTATLASAAEALEQLDIEVLGGLCLLDRRVASEVRDPDLPISAVATLTEALEYGRDVRELDADARALVDTELVALSN